MVYFLGNELGIVFAVNKNITVPHKDAKITYSNIEFSSPKPVKKTMSMLNVRIIIFYIFL